MSSGNRYGMVFTLVELLIVIAIIALLSAILLPALGKARNTALRIYCGNNLRQQSVGVASYINDYGGYYVCHDFIDGSTPSYMAYWSGKIFDYINRSLDTLQCPSHPGRSLAPTPTNIVSYSFNEAFRPWPSWTPIKFSQVVAPSSTMMITDATLGRVGFTYEYAWSGITNAYDRVDFRHGIHPITALGVTNYAGSANMLYADSHVESAKRSGVPLSNVGLWTLRGDD